MRFKQVNVNSKRFLFVRLAGKTKGVDKFQSILLLMFYLLVILLEIHERRTVTKQELDILIQLSKRKLLSQRSKQSTK